MLDASIINEAYDELNEMGEEVKSTAPVEKYEDKRDPKIERVRKLVSDIQGILYKIEDSAYNDEYGKEDDDIRGEMKKSLTKTMIKMVDRLKDVVNDDIKDKKKDDDKDEEENKEEDDKDEEEDKDEDEDEDDEDEEEEEDKEEELKKNSKEEIVSQIMKLFPTESVISPQGKHYAIVEINEEKSLLKDVGSGENFKIDTNILKKWKNN